MHKKGSITERKDESEEVQKHGKKLNLFYFDQVS